MRAVVMSIMMMIMTMIVMAVMMMLMKMMMVLVATVSIQGLIQLMGHGLYTSREMSIANGDNGSKW